MVNGESVGWDTALDGVANRFGDVIAEHGPDSVAFYVAGQLLTEDYYVANKLMKGFIGSANIDTNSRLCMSSTVAGHKRAFGTDTVPGIYDDLDEAELVVLVGSNLAWCHPVLYQRVIAAHELRGTRIVTIDPRRTASCAGALHLQLKAGSDVALFNALLAEIDRRGAIDTNYADAHVEGLSESIATAKDSDSSLTGLSTEQLQEFLDLWIGTEKVVTIFSQGVNQSSSGTDKVNAILNCHLATGRIGKPGTGPFSVTGQVNAMGGREVGGLSNMLACHLDIENPEHNAAVKNFWKAPVMPEQAGLRAVDMFKGVEDGRIKALWIIHSNPAVTLPDADRVRDAIAACPFVVVSDITGNTDTARLADVILPAAAWAEKSGTVTNSERLISRQRAVLPAPGLAKPDWWILAEVARRMGWSDSFAWESPAEIFAEYAALSGIAGKLGKDFDISALAEIGTQAYEKLDPIRWPQSASKQGGRFFANGGFFHPGGKAKMLALTPRGPAETPSEAQPFRLNTGRLRDQWHTMTRTSLSSRLSAHLPEPFVDMNPQDVKRLGLDHGDLVRLSSTHGSAILRLHQTDDVVPGDLFVPMHWTGMNAPTARVDALVAPVTDPVSGQPESKASTVAAKKFAAAWYGFAMSTTQFIPESDYWAQARTNTGYRCELAGLGTPDNWEDYARLLFGLPDAAIQHMSDNKRGRHSIGLFDGEILLAALYVGAEPVVLMRDFLVGLPGHEAPWALAGQARGDTPDPGPVVCSCYAIGRNTVKRAIANEALISVDQIGRSLSAGTNCGSCKSELASILKDCHEPAVAEST
ncbi:molybdopterin-dependent oxidoreductase [Granulosicoccus antarcticus]|uniref:Nitrate reductase n=1 Tax=Granulosicoccus antarcticus IMCC3135 TaxID=1192854 RepID=A0A2Z2P0G4_9GAMM|nr:molybdopterin-dependent oxidoreductase [Granulosicoccus antarcticus]ASJ73677.1 Nitrate reductase [Granulosicoccus antarcticus IMCC3135]